MKKTVKVITTILVLSILLTSCKKKETTNNSNTSTTTTTGGTPAHVNTMTATINNHNWAMLTNSQGYSAYSISKFSNSYSFAGQTNFTNPYSAVRLSFTYTTGVFGFVQYSNFSAGYTDTNNVSYSARTGTINIITLDTLPPGQGIIKKLKANFSFVTDTIGNKSYTITNGLVDYINQ